MDDGSKTTVTTISRLRRNIRYAVAGATILLLIVLAIEAYKFYSLSPEKLFAEKYEAYDLTSLTDTTESNIEKAYQAKNYKEVIKLNRNATLSVRDVFLTGMAYLETKDYAKAISSYQVVIADANNRNRRLRDDAEYYLALAYLQNRDYDQAIGLMSSIYNSPIHVYKDHFGPGYINRIKKLKWR